ncbi:hypothetical protein LDENG_00133700, partial [Lucifuga dentata]
IYRAGSGPVNFALINVRSLANKTFILNDFISSHNIDFLFLTETWLRVGDLSSFIELCPPNYSFFNSPRLNGHGGGLAVFFREHFSCSFITVGTTPSFEVLMFSINCQIPVCCIVVYRPPKPSTSFLSEFSDFMSSVVLKYDKILLTGDFNIHVDHFTAVSQEFLTMCDSFNLVQHVSSPTREAGHTLDLVFTAGLSVNSLSLKEEFISDHKIVLCDIALRVSAPSSKHIVHSRIFQKNSIEQFSSVFNKNTSRLSLCIDVNVLVDHFNILCSSTLDSIAPFRIRSRHSSTPTPRINEDVRQLKRECRRVERRWKKTRLQVHLLCLKELLATYNQLDKNNSRFLFKTIDHLVNPAPSSACDSSAEKCEMFFAYFVEKIQDISSNMESSNLVSLPLVPSPTHLNEFTTISLEDLYSVVSHMRLSSCELDILPSKFFKEVLHVIASCLLKIVNSSLSSGIVPKCFKQTSIQPLLKKPGLDPSLPQDYRPISKLPLVSKILEKVAAGQLMDIVEGCDILYVLPLGHIIRQFNIISYCYADDTQLYMSFKPDSFANVDTLHCCLLVINSWMSSNYPQLNPGKTEVLVFGPEPRNLGVIFDSNLNFDQHVTKLVQSCFLQLRNIAKMSSYLPKTVISQIHAFISSCLDYCNSLFSCLAASATSRLQMVQNAAARLLTHTKRREHITPVLASLHWLPVHFQIQFKIL